jgi:hypothetical protein
MNHPLSELQKKYAQNELNIDDFLFLDDEIKEYFLNISPFDKLDLEKLGLVLKLINSYL